MGSFAYPPPVPSIILHEKNESCCITYGGVGGHQQGSYYRDYSARQGASCFWKRSLLMQCHQYQLVCLTPCWGDSQTNACQEHKKLFSSSFLILANFRWAKSPHFIRTFLMVPNHSVWGSLPVTIFSISPPKSADFLDKHKITSKNATVIKENDTAWPPPQLALRRPLHAWPRSFFFLSYMSWLGRD